MPKNYTERSLIQFQKEFSDDEACVKHLIDQRWPDGFLCPRCGYRDSWYLYKRRLFDCKVCRHQTSVTAGTVFHGTRMPLIKWYWMIYHMAIDKVGVSVAEMQRFLDIGQYRTAWLMAHKIRKAMADRDTGYGVAGLVEMDERELFDRIVKVCIQQKPSHRTSSYPRADRSTLRLGANGIGVFEKTPETGKKAKPPQKHLPTFSDLLNLISAGASPQDIRDDIIRVIGNMAADGFDAHQIKKIFNDRAFPTLSGKKNWTVSEIKKLLRYL